MVKTSPSRLPKFHHILKLTGEGRSISTPLTILIKGLLWRMRVAVTPPIFFLRHILNKGGRADLQFIGTYF